MVYYDNNNDSNTSSHNNNLLFSETSSALIFIQQVTKHCIPYRNPSTANDIAYRVSRRATCSGIQPYNGSLPPGRCLAGPASDPNCTSSLSFGFRAHGHCRALSSSLLLSRGPIEPTDSAT